MTFSIYSILLSYRSLIYTPVTQVTIEKIRELKIMDERNYLKEIPDDIAEIIAKFVEEDDYNIFVKTYRDYFSWRLNTFIDDRMHKNICRFKYVVKAGENSSAFKKRDNIANIKLQDHIYTMVRYMKLPKIKKILRNNHIYNAKKIYERDNPTCKKIIDCYEREVLAQYITSGYYTRVYVEKIKH
jgi:hypothetical protein